METKFDVAIIGAGIVGLAHAWAASRKGKRVGVFERSSEACGATVRNFGMIWPVGQPQGGPFELAMKSREKWLELGELGVTQVQQCGSIHVAHRNDEMSVLEEMHEELGSKFKMLSAKEIEQHTGLVNPHNLIGGLWSPYELRVDPRLVARQLAEYLGSQCSVTIDYEMPIVSASDDGIVTASGETIYAEQILVCSGADLQTLFPSRFADSNLRRCKLQMLACQVPEPKENSPHIASGLTLRHYASFSNCPSLPELRTRIAREQPELDRYGIHVMASEFPNGRVVLGDSHEYDEEITPFDKGEINELMIRELQKIIRLESWRIEESWHGVYAKHPEQLVYTDRVGERVVLFTGTGGAGMTLAFGLAFEFWDNL